MILVLSAPEDVHASTVLEQLRLLGAEARLLDLSLFPVRATVAMEFGAADGDVDRLCWPDAEAFDARRCRAVWFRRPQTFVVDPSVRDEDVRGFAFTECQEAMEGLWRGLPAAWMNEPLRDEAASKKSFQLRVARDAGLPIPRTLVTNDPAAARRFAAELGPERTVYKAFAATDRHWRETRILRPGELDRLDAVQHAPVIFQEYVRARHDVRVTVVGDRVFAAAIRPAADAYAVDFRMSMTTASIWAITLPPRVVSALRTLMQRLGLVYGAIDLRETDAGEFVFLEINPAGQWLFVEDATGQPISAAIARWLATADGAAGRERSAPKVGVRRSPASATTRSCS